MATTTATCRKCGATFIASPTGRTVHCPACRGRGRVTGVEHGTVAAVMGGCTCGTCTRYVAARTAAHAERARRISEGA